MTISSRKPKKEAPTPETSEKWVFQLSDDETPSAEELERIKKVFEKIKDALDGFYGV